MHNCTARHVESKPVTDLVRGEVVWEGIVETFEVTGLTRAKRCYAWSYLDKDESFDVTVLEIPPVDSAEMAVKVALVGLVKSMNKNTISGALYKRYFNSKAASMRLSPMPPKN